MKPEDGDIDGFLSDARAIQHARLPVWARHTILVMVTFFAVAIIWACVGKVDVIVNANGRIVSSHPTIVMKPLERAVIKEIHVAIGDRVKKGDPLVTFDTTFSRADMERLASEMRVAEALRDRLTAEYADEFYETPENPTEEEKTQLRLFNDRKRYFEERKEYFERELERIDRTIQSLNENLKLQEKRLAGFRDIEGMMVKARSSKAVSPRDLKEAEIARMQLEAEISDKKNSVLALESERLSRDAERRAFLANWEIDISQELTRAQTSLNNIKKDYDKARQMAEYVELRAPEDAVVHDIAPMSIGSAAREAETLITLAPTGGRLEVEAEIGADDIAKVKPGDEARVKISAYPFQKYGVASGSVRVISEDAFTNQTPSGAPVGSFYRSRIALDEHSGNDFDLVKKLIPGMEAQAEIIIGTRRVIEYLVHPLIKALDEAIREP